jgi:hypothetical protein
VDAATIQDIAKKADAGKREIIRSLADEQVETSARPLKQVFDEGLCTFLRRTQILCSLNKGAWRADHGTTKKLFTFEC